MSRYLVPAALGMEMVAGRFFDPNRPKDSAAIIINESAARLFAFDDPIGKQIYHINAQITGAPREEDFEGLTIIGVVKDFNWSSLRENIGALAMTLGNSRGLISFRYQGADTKSVITALERNFKEMAPGQPFSHRFLDESFFQMYRTEQRLGNIAGIFALLSIFVSCLGLFGLAAFTAEQKTKEIGVRKVLGATTVGIIAMFSKEFMKWVVLGIGLAIPITWYFMNKWLSNFAYHVDLGWWIFALAGLIALMVAFLTISFQSIKAALVNPIKSLRSE